MRKAIALAAALVAASALGQAISVPPSGDNQHAVVTQYIGPVAITVDYHSPNVHAPNGDDRRGKIWGGLVPYGLTDLGFGTCGKQCPWRAGANENTTFTVSHDVLINGQKLPAGSYGVHMIADPDDWTLIFSKNSSSWGSFYYDAAEDALRVKVKPARSEYHEWLTYEFTDRDTDHATVAMKWEDLQVPWTVKVPDITDVHIAAIRDDLRTYNGFLWQNWMTAARYALGAKRLDDALEFARVAAGVARPNAGQENYMTLMTLADVQEAKAMTADAKATRDKALIHPTATAGMLHQYARQQLQKGNKAEAVRVWEMNAKRHPNEWPVNVGLMRAYSAQGKFKDALKYGKLALPQAPDDTNKKNIEDSIKKLEEGKDVNG